MAKKDARSLPPGHQEQLRRKAIRLFLRGEKKTRIAISLSVSRQAVQKWVKKYNTQGETALAPGRKGRPRETALKDWQVVRLLEIINSDTKSVWSKTSVAALIEKEFKIKVSPVTAWRYLKRWGFFPRRILRLAFQNNPEETLSWLNGTYPRLLKRAEREGGMILWGDEQKTGYGCYAVSAVSNRGELGFIICRKKPDSVIFRHFLILLAKKFRGKIFLILDANLIHRSQKIFHWLKSQKGKIELLFLPKQTPEINPDQLFTHAKRYLTGPSCLTHIANRNFKEEMLRL